MAKLSKHQRKIIGETIRQTVANLGLVAPVKHERNDGGIDHSNPKHGPEKTPPQNFFDLITECFTIGIPALLFAIFSGGIINYLGQFPQILNFGAWGISAMLICGACKMVWFHGRHWAVLSIALIGVALICIPTWGFVENKSNEIALAKSERRDERNIITNTPNRFDRVDAAISNIPNPSLILHEYVKGTHITHEQLAAFFPFGYAVFYFDKSERLTHEVFNTGLLEWKIDWDKVEIKPDISTGNVRWSIPDFGSKPNTNFVVFANDSHSERSPFEVGVFEMGIFISRRDPMIYGAILSDDQRNPIFAIGFRVLSSSLTNDVRQLFIHDPRNQ